MLMQYNRMQGDDQLFSVLDTGGTETGTERRIERNGDGQFVGVTCED